MSLKQKKHNYGLNDKFPVGKYKDQLIKIIIREDPGYLQWALRNIDWFQLSHYARKRLEITIRTNRQEEAEIRQEAFEELRNNPSYRRENFDPFRRSNYRFY